MNKVIQRPNEDSLWAYAYDLTPPQTESRLSKIQKLLDDEHVGVKGSARKWAGRIVLEKETTHILIVSNSSDQESGINRKLEAELRKLKVGFAITAPMAVVNNETPARAEKGMD